MGNDTPLACLSGFQPLMYEYFKQLFAQASSMHGSNFDFLYKMQMNYRFAGY
jgi:hypothetical protein